MVKGNARNQGSGSNVKQKNSKRVFKSYPKSANRKDIKRVSDASKLNWKKVDITDTPDDFGCFYGLEEIEGVDIEIVDGKVNFIATDESKFKNSTDLNEDDIESKNSDCILDDELSVASSDVDAGSENEEEELQTNLFTHGIDLLDSESPVMPGWTDKMDLSITTLHGLAKLGFTKPTEIQAASIPNVLRGLDVIGKACTGSGKTLAFGIPIIEAVIGCSDSSKPVGLVFTPTRELAHQVTNHLQKVAYLLFKKNPYAILSVTGGLSIQKQRRLLGYDGSARIVVATPGRFLELLKEDQELIKRFSKIDILVLDEADRLLQDGHFDEFEKITRYLINKRKLDKEHVEGWQTIIFSATFSFELSNKLSSTSYKNIKGDSDSSEMDPIIQHLIRKLHFRSKPIIIDTNPEQKVTSRVCETLIQCMPTERDLYVYYFVSMYARTSLVFCNSIESVKRLTAFLNILNLTAYQVHSSMLQKNRLKNLEKFQDQVKLNEPKGIPTVLIASDVAARGLDIPGINHVIHYHLPRSADVYIHRSGRTARVDNEGVSVIICSPQEVTESLRKLRKLLANKSGSSKTKKWEKDIPLLPIDSDIVAQLRERTRIASALADNEVASKSLHKDDTWLKKAADDLDIELDDKDEIKDVFLAKNKAKKMNKQIDNTKAKAMRKQLKLLLDIPIRKDNRKSYLTGGITNLAQTLIDKKGHNYIVGLGKVDALKYLRHKNGRNQ